MSFSWFLDFVGSGTLKPSFGLDSGRGDVERPENIESLMMVEIKTMTVDSDSKLEFLAEMRSSRVTRNRFRIKFKTKARLRALHSTQVSQQPES